MTFIEIYSGKKPQYGSKQASMTCAQSCVTLCNPVDYSLQAPLSMGFSQKEYRSGLPSLPPRNLPDTVIKPMSPAL